MDERHYGQFVFVDNAVPTVPHALFSEWVSEEDFISQALHCFNTRTGQMEADAVEQELTAILSNYMNMAIVARSYNNTTIFYTEFLFTPEEISVFMQAYKKELMCGPRALLALRKVPALHEYAKGKIALHLNTQVPVHGKIEIHFQDATLFPFLLEMKMEYTQPVPGSFRRVEVDKERTTIIFYV